HDLRSVWSHPLLDARRQVIGTFAVYRSVPHYPDPDEIAGVDAVATLAGLAIERFRSERALTKAASRDPLTGLPNRALFFDEVQRALERSARTSQPCALLFIDIDGFKHINDALGHAAGDRVLADVAHRLVALLPVGSVVARLGGDEFTVLVEGAVATMLDE